MMTDRQSMHTHTGLDAPAIFKTTAMVTFLSGALLHTSHIVLGDERFLRDVFSPWVEAVFAPLMIVATIAGWMSWKRFAGTKLGRFAYGFALVFITISIPIHVRSVVIWSTAWVHAFPMWYSIAEVPLFLFLFWTVKRLRFGARS